VSQAVSPDNATVRKALVDFTADEQLTKRLFGPMGNDAWAISRKFNDEAFKEIPAARTALQAMGGADARFKLFNRRKAKNGPSMQALLAAMPAEAYIIECRVEVSQGGKRGLTDFLDCVLLDGEVRAIGSIELLLHELVERGKLVMPQIASRPLVPLDDAGKGFAGNTAGQTRNDNELQLMVVWCPPGKFRMGSSDQEQKKWGGSPKDSELTPAEQRSLRQRGSSATVVFSDGPDLSNEQQVDVELTSGFWIGQTEITREQWQRVMGTEPWKGSQWAKEGNGYPVISIVADDALDFCRRLTTQERDAGRLPAGWEYNLPTEAQWEYACRAGTETAFSFGDTADQLDEFEWTYRNCVVVGKDHPHPVAGKKPNVWGIYDMHGNVAEFCRDWYFDRISGGVDPLGAAIGDAHSARGGNWVSHEPSCRSAARSAAVVEAEINAFQGFRVAIVRSMVEETAK
jgi:formylglycine-generating enzyme required for sulfatase activity